VAMIQRFAVFPVIGLLSICVLSFKVVSQNAAASEKALTLENTYWSLAKVGDTTLPERHDPRKPHVILNAEAHRVGGSGGCNGILGKYELSGDRLAFKDVGATRLACKEGMDIERAFLNALNRVTSWRITGRKLDLSDDEGHVLLEFAAASVK
jgi:heat shock protein HslJ